MMTRIFQYHPSVIGADAIGYSIQSLHSYLLEAGQKSYILCSQGSLRNSVKNAWCIESLERLPVTEFKKDDLLIVHFSFLDVGLERIMQLPIKKALVYHNVTPGRFFRDAGMDWLANACDEARDQLAKYAGKFDFLIAVSAFNAKELDDFGGLRAQVIPVFIRPNFYECDTFDVELYERIKSQASVNVLFVGRFVPNKKIEKVIALASEYSKRFDRSIRLHIAGKIWDQSYFSKLIAIAENLNVVDLLQFYISADQLTINTLYKAASVFVSASEHEGFMVPIIEAFASGCPVIAGSAGAIAETMGGAGILLDDFCPELAASTIKALSIDSGARREIVLAQRHQAEYFHPRYTAQKWFASISTFV